MKAANNPLFPSGNPAIAFPFMAPHAQNPNNSSSEYPQPKPFENDIRTQDSQELSNIDPISQTSFQIAPLMKSLLIPQVEIDLGNDDSQSGLFNSKTDRNLYDLGVQHIPEDLQHIPEEPQYIDSITSNSVAFQTANVDNNFTQSEEPQHINSMINNPVAFQTASFSKNFTQSKEPQPTKSMISNPVEFQTANFANNFTQSSTLLNKNTSNAMEVEYGSQSLFQPSQMQKQNPYSIPCPTHPKKSVVSLCFSKGCQAPSRLLCVECNRVNQHHQNHDIFEIEEIIHLNQDCFLPIQNSASHKLSAAFSSQPMETQQSPEFIENQLKQLEEFVSDSMKKAFKEIMVSVQGSNSMLSQQKDYCRAIIAERYSVNRLLKAYYQYMKSNKEIDLAGFVAVLNEYAENYSNEQALEDILPQNKTTINIEKFKQAQAAFKEAFSILSEAVVFQAQTDFKFQQPTYAKAKRYVQLVSNDTGVMCSNKSEPIAVLGDAPLEIDRCYSLTFLAEGIKPNLCWGVFLVLSQFANDDNNNNLPNSLCWPTSEKGVFCCFDGDCCNYPNSLQHSGTVQKLTGTFKLTIHIAQRIFKIRNEFGTYSAELLDKDKLSADGNYYLGFALNECKLANLPSIKNNQI